MEKARVPPYLHKSSNHVYSVWQHLVLLTLRQYERKSYRRFVEFLEEAFGVVGFLGLSRIPHYTTLQKAAARLRHGMLLKILESFLAYCQVSRMLAGMDATGLSHGQASYYYTKKFKLRRKFVKITICADLKRQIVCGIKIRHRRRNDMYDFTPLLRKLTGLARVGTMVADRGFDSEQNHVDAGNLGVERCIIRPRYENLKPSKTRGEHRRRMKRRFPWRTYHQRSKMETIFSVIKGMLGDSVTSRSIVTQNRETLYRVIAYNCYRITRNYFVIFGWFLRGLVGLQFMNS
ncbi:MAG: IS5 family transposase [Candidatus Micrarchaeota archaeon]|nr:IS5 family transposase [Candidatus Micrarchaeota archaeon]